MTRALTFVWLIVVIAFALLALAVLSSTLFHLFRFGTPPVGTAWFTGSILLSGGTVTYAGVELLRYSGGRRSFLPRVASVILIFVAAATSVLTLASSMPKRSADTTIIPELALPPDDPRVATPAPTPDDSPISH